MKVRNMSEAAQGVSIRRPRHDQMSIIAKDLSDNDIANVADWFASLKFTVKLPWGGGVPNRICRIVAKMKPGPTSEMEAGSIARMGLLLGFCSSTSKI